MNDWQELQIKDVIEGLYDGPHATPPPSLNGPVFLGIQNITPNGKLNLSSIRHINENDWPKWTRRVTPQENDIVFTYEATLNLYALIPKGFRGCLGRRMALLRVDPEKINYKYLYYYFFSPQWRQVISENTLSGATVDRIPLTKFPSFPINVPVRRTQDSIVAHLSAIDDLMEVNSNRISALEEMAQRLYREWFVIFKFPGHENVKMVDSGHLDFGMVPEGWKVRQLGDIADEVRNSINPKDFYKYFNYFGLEHLPRKSFTLGKGGNPEAVTSSKLLFHLGDILFGKIRPYFHKVCFAETSGLCSSDTIVIRSKNPRDLALVRSIAFSDMFVAGASAASKGTKMPRADWPVMKKYLLTYPDENTLKQFSDLINPIVSFCANLMQQNIRLEMMRSLLLPKLISGEIDLSEVSRIDIENEISKESEITVSGRIRS